MMQDLVGPRTVARIAGCVHLTVINAAARLGVGRRDVNGYRRFTPEEVDLIVNDIRVRREERLRKAGVMDHA